MILNHEAEVIDLCVQVIPLEDVKTILPFPTIIKLLLNVIFFHDPKSMERDVHAFPSDDVLTSLESDNATYVLFPYEIEFQKFIEDSVVVFHEIPSLDHIATSLSYLTAQNLLLIKLRPSHDPEDGSDLCVHVIPSVEVADTDEFSANTTYNPAPYAPDFQFAVAGNCICDQDMASVDLAPYEEVFGIIK